MRATPGSLYPGVVMLAAYLVAGHPGAAVSPPANPEGGRVASAAYTNAYFGLSYPLPADWTEGLAGPPASQSGAYVLASLVPKGELAGTMLIAAQDAFFAIKPFADASEMTAEFAREIANIPGMTIDRAPAPMRIAGHDFSRVDFSGVGLYRAMLVTERRCHFVSFNLMTRSPKELASLAAGLDRLSFAAENEASVPACMKDYAVGENVLHKVEPVAAGPRFTPIPVRIIIGSDGGVAHVHVIRATPEQRKSIEDALRQWKLKPYETKGRAVALETGLVFEFKPTN